MGPGLVGGSGEEGKGQSRWAAGGSSPLGCPGPSPRLLPPARIGGRLPELFAIGQAAGGGVGEQWKLPTPVASWLTEGRRESTVSLSSQHPGPTVLTSG